jgi:DNA-binding MarR family transcriptional regulator
LVSDGDISRARARSMLVSEGWRIVGEPRPPIVEQPGFVPLLWVELTQDPDEAALEMLGNVVRGVGDNCYSAAIAATPAWIDLLAAKVSSPAIHLLIDPTPAERIATLAVVQASALAGVRENSPERTEARLKQLSDEVNRIAGALARLSSAPISADTTRPVQPGEGPAVSAETVRSIIRARRLRDQFMPADLFADPAWDILLDLLQAEIIQHRVPVSSLCIASAVPATTALRWIRSMTERDMLVRREDPHDARRVFIELAPPTSAAMRHYFDKVGPQAVV